MNPKYRFVYLFFGFAGYAFLIYHVIATIPSVNPGNVLVIAIADYVFFFLAYQTYPGENYLKRYNLNLSSSGTTH